jgi:hypothetical protein
VRRWRDRVTPSAVGVYTAEPDTEDAERLALAVVLGTQSLID